MAIKEFKHLIAEGSKNNSFDAAKGVWEVEGTGMRIKIGGEKIHSVHNLLYMTLVV